MNDRHLGNKEVAEYLGIDRIVLKVFRSRYPGLFPEPAAKLACGPIWHESQLNELKMMMEKGGVGALREAALTIAPEYQRTKEHAGKRRKVIAKAVKEDRPIAITKEK